MRRLFYEGISLKFLYELDVFTATRGDTPCWPLVGVQVWRFVGVFSLFLSINSRSVFLIHYFEALQLYWGQKYLRILEKAPPQSEKTQGSSSIAAGLTPDEVQL